jgi:PDZ domain-containing protein
VRRALQVVVPAAALAVSLYAVDLPLFAEYPGRARAVLPLIDIDGAPTYPSDGRLLLTTVNIGRLSLYEALAAWLDPNANVIPERQLIPPGQTDEQFDEASRSQMDQSKIAAVAVALERLTEYPEEEHGRGVIVQDVVPGTPADGVLFAGDLISEVDGRPVDDVDDLVEAIEAAGTTDTLRMGVAPLEGGEFRTVAIRPTVLQGEDRPVIGISSVANFPFDVRIESGAIGGPSAGLMWAVGITELLTPGDLTEGRTLAGTGSIDLEGNVGPIGGIRLKILAAERAGAEAFLVPQGNLAEARGAGEEIELVPVATVEDALRYLEAP